ncbi:SufS family cysteine desulfurase [Kamptonema cortianum]|nr:SufS family cysteine desulfurase [Geitlerinema splendidum]MDK3162483.1 SufS family cysteine desulfurase [Kamptonema cortianum]
MATSAKFNLGEIQSQFPILGESVHGSRLAFLDSAASTQKPLVVLQAMDSYYRQSNANVHRGVYELSERATALYDAARAAVAKFIGASSSEIIFTKGCTESVNLLAHSLQAQIKPGDRILVSEMEHHANLVPWQVLSQRTGAELVKIPVTPKGEIDLDQLKSILNEPTKIVAIKHVCNALGTINPVGEIIRLAKQAGAITIVDGAQSLAHVSVDVEEIDCDFYVGSAHKVYGPMGVGFVYGRQELLQKLPPYQTGGDMIERVSFESSTYADPPGRFEAGTPNVGGAIGFAAALEWLNQFDFAEIRDHEDALRLELEGALRDIPGVHVHGPTEGKVGIVSFTCDFAHPHDIASVMNQHGVAVRSGHHCCMPLMARLNLPGTVRASFGVYNTSQDIQSLTQGLLHARDIFA